MQDYYRLLKEVRKFGEESDDRTGTGTLSLFGDQMEFYLKEGFPLLTGKYTSFKLIAAELLWFLSGSTNNEDLRKLNGNDKPTIWEEWSLPDGSLGPIYGWQWRNWIGSDNDNPPGLIIIDQIKEVIDGLKKRPHSRRHICSAWNVTDLPNEALSPHDNVRNGQMALAPCHCLFQFHARRLSEVERAELVGGNFLENWREEANFVHESCLAALDAEHIKFMNERGIPAYELSCKLYQRSGDLFLGIPYNIASYALLTHMIAHVCNMTVGRFIHTLGDSHIYLNHLEQVDELLSRDHTKYPLPSLEIKRKIDDIDDFKLEDFEVVGYQSHPAIKAPVAI